MINDEYILPKETYSCQQNPTKITNIFEKNVNANIMSMYDRSIKEFKKAVQ